jgi:medium-chain acyl-[acyl-carrier-protein] hydrolase
VTNTPTFNSWVTYPKSNPQASLRLFCFPYTGGGAFSFRTWTGSLPKTIEVCPIELPGRGTQIGLVLFTRLEPLVQAIAQSLLPHLDKPFAFFGHSMGALVSFEVARLLRKQNEREPVQLFVSGCRALQIPSPEPLLHTLPEPAFLDRLRRLNATPKAVLENVELMQLLLPVLRADVAVIETYVYASEPPLNCLIAVFGGLQNVEVDFDCLQAWRQQTNASSLQMLSGDHFFLHSAQALLLQSLTQHLQARSPIV